MTTLNITFPAFGFFSFKNKEEAIINQKTSIKDFLEFLASNPTAKFELIDGVIIPMSNASPRHGKIISNFSGIAVKHLADNGNACFYFSDIQCKIDEFTCPHPDIVVVCNESVDSALLEYPTVVGEVHSPSNKDNDFNKLVRYKNCKSIKEILMIEQDEMKVTVYTRKGLEWVESVYQNEDTIFLKSIQLQMSLKNLYSTVKFDKK